MDTTWPTKEDLESGVALKTTISLAKKDIFRSEWFRKLAKNYQEMVKTLLDRGYWFFLEKPYVGLAIIDGQEVKLPFTNCYCIVLLKQNGGKWFYCTRWCWSGTDEKEPVILKINYEDELGI